MFNSSLAALRFSVPFVIVSDETKIDEADQNLSYGVRVNQCAWVLIVTNVRYLRSTAQLRKKTTCVILEDNKGVSSFIVSESSKAPNEHVS